MPDFSGLGQAPFASISHFQQRVDESRSWNLEIPARGLFADRDGMGLAWNSFWALVVFGGIIGIRSYKKYAGSQWTPRIRFCSLWLS